MAQKTKITALYFAKYRLNLRISDVICRHCLPFEHTHEAIIEESVFLVVQNIRQARCRPTKMGDMGMFSGLVYCADCGGKMYLCRANHFKPEQDIISAPPIEKTVPCARHAPSAV